MEEKDNNENEIEKTLVWETEPEIYLPSYFKMEIPIEIDLTVHDDALDKDYRRLYTDPMKVLKIDLIDELEKLKIKGSQFLVETDIMDDDYFTQKSERTEMFKRFEQQTKLNKKDICFNEHLKNSFDTIYEMDDDVEESYPVLMADEEQSFILIANSIGQDFSEYTIEKKEGSKKTITVNNKPSFLIIQESESYLCLEIRSGNAYFSFTERINKLFYYFIFVDFHTMTADRCSLKNNF